MSDARMPDRGPNAAPYDALLLLSFGGPEGPDDVVPFLENVTRGRGIPRERLAEVGEHYFLFGGVSPINAQNRALLAALARGLRRRRPRPAGLLGQPQLGAVPGRHAARDGRRRAPPRAWSWPPAPTPRTPAAGSTGRTWPPRWPCCAPRAAERRGLDKLRHYFNHPGFVEPMIDATLGRARPRCPRPARRRAARPSPPTRSRRLGRHVGPGARPRHRRRLRRPAPGHRPAGRRRGRARPPASTAPGSWSTSSRSGAPQHPVAGAGHLRPPGGACTPPGAPAVVMVPIGFVSDHMEVEVRPRHRGRRKAAELGLPVARAAHRRAPTRASPRRCANWCWNGPRPSAAGARRAARSARSARATTSARRAAARPRTPLPAAAGTD